MQPIVLSAAISGLCAVMAAIVAGLFSHAAGKRSGAAQMLSSVQAMWSGLTKSLHDEIARLTQKVEAAEKRCEDAEAHHRSCRTELDQLWATIKAKPIPPYEPKPQPRKRRKPRAPNP